MSPSHTVGTAANTLVVSGLSLDQLHCLQARVAVLADDEVVVHGNAELPRDLDDCPRHVDVGARGGWDRRRDGCARQRRATYRADNAGFVGTDRMIGGADRGR